MKCTYANKTLLNIWIINHSRRCFTKQNHVTICSVSFAVSHISSCFSSSSSKFANISQHMLNQWLTTMNPYVWKVQILANLHMWAKSLRVIGPHQPKKKYVYSLLYIPISPLLLLSLLPSLSLPFLPPFPLLFKRKDKSFGYHNYQKKAAVDRLCIHAVLYRA